MGIDKGRSEMKKTSIILVAALVLAAWTASVHAGIKPGAGTKLGLPEDPMEAGDSAPDFTLEELGTGKQITLSSYFGKKVVMLEFWATWCNICKTELPNLVKEYNEWKDKGFETLAITLTDGGANDVKKIQQLREKHSITYPILLDKNYDVATNIYKLSGPIPLKLIIDCAGKLRYEHVGDFADGVSEVPAVLEVLLAEPSCKK